MAELGEGLSKIVPVLTAILVCDAAVADRSTGKKTLVGIFDRIVGHFPTQHPMSVYMKVSGALGRYQFKVRFVSRESGEALAEFSNEFEFKDRLTSSDFYLEAPPLPIRSPGRYEFQVWANDIYLGAAFLDAIPRK